MKTPNIVISENLQFDRALNALILKMVPGLFHREMTRVRQFWAKEHNKDSVQRNSDGHVIGSLFEKILLQDNGGNADVEFVAPEELIR